SAIDRWPCDETTTAGRRLLCSRPTTGSSTTHTISPGVGSAILRRLPPLGLLVVALHQVRGSRVDLLSESRETTPSVGERRQKIQVLPQRAVFVRRLLREPIATVPTDFGGGGHTRSIPVGIPRG